jgi:cytochrome bd-type quinol oxidase subunit 2
LEVKNFNVLDYAEGLRIAVHAFYVSLTQHWFASLALFCALSVAACFALQGAIRNVTTNSRVMHNTLPKHTAHATAYCLVVLLALVFILQSPISKLAFPESTHVVLVSYRLFCMPLAVISVLLATAFTS